MTTRNVTAIALRLFALWLLVQIISHIPSLFMLVTVLGEYRGTPPSYLEPALFASSCLIGLLAAYLIWRAAGSALQRSDATLPQTLDLDGQRFLLQLGGICLAVLALAPLPRTLGFMSYGEKFSFIELLAPVSLLLQLIVGLALVIGAARWTALLARLRGRR